MSSKLAFEAIFVVAVTLFTTAFAVTWKDCGECNAVYFRDYPLLLFCILFVLEISVVISCTI